jgi:hypothetical protein
MDNTVTAKQIPLNLYDTLIEIAQQEGLKEEEEIIYRVFYLHNFAQRYNKFIVESESKAVVQFFPSNIVD